MKYIFEYTGRKITSYNSETKQYKVTTAKNNSSIYNLHKTVYCKDYIVANTPYTMYNKLFNNGDKISISKKTITLNYYKKTGYWNIDTKRTRMTFNLKTGMTYIIEGKKIKNISYSTSNTDYIMRSCNMYPGVKTIDEDEIFKEAYELISNYKEKMYNKKPVEYEYIANLALFNRFPYIVSESLFKELDYTIKYMNKVSQDSYIDQAILSTVNNTKISKGLRKSILNSSKYKGVLTCKALIIANKLSKYLKVDNVRKLFDSLNIFTLNRLSGNINFIKNIPEHLENSFINKIVKDSGLICDTLHMYDIVLSSNKDYKIDYRKSIKEIHDDLSEISYVISNPLIKFKNTKEERALEYSDEKYCIKLAKTNYELRDIGNTMHICVGSYSDYVKKRLLSIYTLQDNNRNPIVCIEVRDNKVMQCKMKFNNPVYTNQELLEYINKWINKNKLESYSYDLHTSDDVYPLPPTTRNNQAV